MQNACPRRAAIGPPDPPRSKLQESLDDAPVLPRKRGLAQFTDD
jgi:hypothetical protein